MTWPFRAADAPDGWQSTKLRSFLTRRKETNCADLQLLSVNLPEGVVPKNTVDGGPEPSNDLSKYQEVRPNDLVVNQLGKPHGAIGVSTLHGIISPAYFVAQISPNAIPRYVHYLLRTRLYISEIERRAKYMPPSQFDISWEQFRDIPVSLPPAPIQLAIANYLDNASARIGSLILKKRRLIELLQQRIDAIVFAGIRGGLTSQDATRVPSGIEWLGMIPEHYSLPWIGAHYTTQLGKMLSAEATMGPEQHPYIKNANVLWDELRLDDLPTMTFDADDRRRCELRQGDLLVCEGGEVGRSAIWQHGSDIYFQKAIHRVRPRTQGVPRFLMYCLWAAARQGVFAVEGNQSTIVHLTGEKLRAHRVPWPPIIEQERIVSLIDVERRPIEGAIAVITGQVELLNERMHALITAAVTDNTLRS